MMTETVVNELNKKDGEISPFHRRLLDHVMSLVKGSRAKMSGMYSDWDMQDSVYRGERCPDLDDRKATQRGKPEKMIVPNTFAQIQTFASFQFLMFNQNRRFFELSPTGGEDYGTKQEDSELILERDLKRNEWNIRLFQLLLDVPRFGLGIIDTSWTKDETHIKVAPQPQVVSVNGEETQVPGGEASWQTFLKYEGNLIRSVSPYRFFPDVAHPLSEFQKGSFCACEEEYSLTKLRDLQASGEVAGVDNIRSLPRDYEKQRGGPTRWTQADIPTPWRGFSQDKPNATVLVTKVQVWLIPKKFTFGPKDKPLGPEEFKVLYHVWYANDTTLIRVEPAGWWHNEFSWCVAQFTPDMHRTLNLGLADLIYRLQDVISWYINSHITSVRRVIGNRLIVDPKLIDTKTLDGEGDIYLRKSTSVPLERALGQLRVQDVTSGHMADSELLGKIMEMVTGVNGNAMGQYNSGRRSAQEARVVTAGAAGRMKMHGHLIWESCLGRMGRLMLSNLRQSLSLPSFQRVVGNAQDLQQRFLAFAGTPEEVACGDDFFVFDSTLASEKGFMAQSLQELLSAIMTASPLAAQQMVANLNPTKVLDEIQQLRGAGPVSRFSYSPEEKQMMMLQQQQLALSQQSTSASA